MHICGCMYWRRSGFSKRPLVMFASLLPMGKFYNIRITSAITKSYLVWYLQGMKKKTTIQSRVVSTCADVQKNGYILRCTCSKSSLVTESILSCFLFVKNQWPLVGEILFSPVPAIKLPLVSYHWRAFWADTLPFFHHWLASCIASGTKEKQGHR